MKPAGEIIAALRRFGHFEACEQIAKDYGTAITLVVDGTDRHAEVAQARHAIWEFLVNKYGGRFSPVVRIWGCHHTALLYAETRREIVHVVLASFEDPKGHAKVQLEYKHRPGGRFGVNDLVAGHATWFQTYALAREVFQEMCEGAGAPTFRGAASAAGGGAS